MSNILGSFGGRIIKNEFKEKEIHLWNTNRGTFWHKPALILSLYEAKELIKYLNKIIKK